MAEEVKPNVIERLRENVVQLTKLYRQSEREKSEAISQLADLKAEIEQLKTEIAQLRKRLNDVESEQQRLIAARGFIANEGDTKSARLRVNRLVREIDKCISLLNE